MNASTQLDAFLDYLGSAKRLSGHTLSNYRRDLSRFLNFCEQQGISEINKAASGDIRNYVGYLRRQGLAASSIQRQLSALRSFYNYQIRFYGVKANPAAGISAPKRGRKLPSSLDVDRVQQLMEFKGDAPIDKRDRAIMELFYSSGLRLAELASLNLDDIDLKEGLVTVTGKGRKTRNVPVGGMALNALKQWLAERLNQSPCDEAVFLNNRGERLSHRSIELRIKQRATQAGVPDNLYPHKLRHSFASHMLESSGDLRAVQELLGHANLSTTQIYTHLDYQHLAKVYDNAHPRAQRKPK
ncbi:tyrosine recombinase XerC [Spongiibacter sp. KMU-158]|uniref:Tyrosine recombinase XerC n=1 Tax=Spongiibacter pelagi TaxID=2760804 RepID=A0A927C1A5_9GAMM|nr:tyrosine recombinase XerC [Spongiibacter pelagi]MBD2857816.1 tyrosine recombinase XerC [Spongiibacter pelagi]